MCYTCVPCDRGAAAYAPVDSLCIHFSVAAAAAALSGFIAPVQAHATDSEARSAAAEASEGLRAARIAEMSTTGSMVTLSSLATMDEDVDTLQVRRTFGITKYDSIKPFWLFTF
jgi:hypothetical protein